MKVYCLLFVFLPLITFSQEIYNFPVDNINELIRSGAVQVTHDQFDIGSISDVFDGNPESLARTASINPLAITLEFDFPVTFGGTSILHTYGNGWWTIEAADSQYDLAYEGPSYVKLFEESSLLDGIPDEITFAPETKSVIRLTVRRTTGDDYVHLNEWQLFNAQAEVEISSVCIRPSEIWLLPNKSTEVKLLGTSGDATYEIATDVAWFTNNQAIATATDSNGIITVTAGNQTGSATLIGNWQLSLQSTATIHVVEDFKPIVPATRPVKVALVIIDPPIAAEGGTRFHERFGWADPVELTQATMVSLDAASEGAVDYQIVSTYDEDSLYAILQGHRISVDSMYELFLEPGWTTFHQLEQTGGFAFDYNGLLAAHDFCSQSNSKQIDEVWVYSMPFTGMYESRLTGEGAFWYNSPPLDGNSCVDQLPIMGLNYERGVAEALHSFGHRVESAMVHTYGRWDYNAVDKNDWEKFASYNAAVPQGAHIGNIHFPPNAASDYDYGNPSTVVTFADNWKYYPFLFDKQREVTCSEWDCDHLDYMGWWYRHIPHFTCKNVDGILNNWWSYIVDYNGGKLLEKQTSDCICQYAEEITATHQPQVDPVFRIYPSPAHDSVTIEFRNNDAVGEKVILYNSQAMKLQELFITGQRVEIDLQKLTPGSYTVSVESKSGVVYSGKILKI